MHLRAHATAPDATRPVPCAARRKPAADQLAHPCAQTGLLSPASGSAARRLRYRARRCIGSHR